MPTGRPHPSDVRVRVVAEIMAGDSITAVAKRHKIPTSTAKTWWAEDRPDEPTSVRTRERMVDELYDCSYECFEGIRATARLLQDPTWARTQEAAGLAALVAALGDRSLRMLGGLRPIDHEQHALGRSDILELPPRTADDGAGV